MTRDQIITELYKSKEVDYCINRMCSLFERPDLTDELKQETFLIISQQSDDLILHLHKSKKIHFFTVRIILNLCRQTRNVFHQTYLNTSVNYSDNFSEPVEESNIEERKQQEQREIELVNRIHNLDIDFNSPVYRLMVMLVDKYGSMGKVSKLTGIPKCVISRGIKKVRQHLCS